MQEIIFAINEAADGGYESDALGFSSFTEGESWSELKENMLEAVSSYFGHMVQRFVRMHFVKDEV